MTRRVDCSCRQTKALVDYVRAKNPENLHLLWAPVQGELPENEDPEQFLRNPDNRVSLEVLRNIMQQTRKATSDDMAVFKAAFSSANGSHLGRVLKKRFRVFFGPKQAIQGNRASIPFLSDRGAEIVSISDTHAVIRLHWSNDLPLSSDFCLYAKGTYQVTPTLFGLAPARLWERACFFEGGSWCEYEIWWDKRCHGRQTAGGHVSPWRDRRPQQWKRVKERTGEPVDAASAQGAGDPSIPDHGAVLRPAQEVSDAVGSGGPETLPRVKEKNEGQGIAGEPTEPLGKSVDFPRNGIVQQYQKVFATLEETVTAMLADVDSGHPHFNGLKGIEAMVRQGADLTARLAGQAKEQKAVSETGGVAGEWKHSRHLPPTEGLAKTKETVLLVDDEEMLVDVGRQMLEAMGYEVLGASKGEEAIKVYEQNKERVHMVILDMVLPDMGGGEAYDKMKAINPQVKVLLSSAYGIDKEANTVLAKGCKGFIQKPFSLKQLSSAMRAILDGKDTVSFK